MSADAADEDVKVIERRQLENTSLRGGGPIAWYCELCERTFVSADVFFDHRKASEYEAARKMVRNDEGHMELANRRGLHAGDEVPGTLGGREPCVPATVEGGGA